jgi:hypothetical protein
VNIKERNGSSLFSALLLEKEGKLSGDTVSISMGRKRLNDGKLLLVVTSRGSTEEPGLSWIMNNRNSSPGLRVVSFQF